MESTEELCSEIETVNKRLAKDGPRVVRFQSSGKSEVGSMDVKNCYPSIDVDMAAEEVKQEVLESDVELEGINLKKVLCS